MYVLGGLVDESIIKNATLSRAKENSVTTRRLPIQELILAQGGYAPVLSINQVRNNDATAAPSAAATAVKSGNTSHNCASAQPLLQVFDALLAFRETGSWYDALNVALPERKGFVLPSKEEVDKIIRNAQADRKETA